MNGMMGQDPQLRSAGRFRNRRTHRATASLVFGSIAIAIGSLLLLDRFGILDAGFVFRLWPAVLLLLGIGMLFRRDRAALVPGVVLTCIGSVFLLRNLGYAEISFRDLWPILLIVIGVAVLSTAIRSRRELPETQDSAGAKERDFLNDWVLFGGVVKMVRSTQFQGGDLMAIFGGVDVNLRKAKMHSSGTAIINANAFFGGIELHVPDDWHVVNEGVGILGGYADSRRFVEASGDPESLVDPRNVLIVRGVAVFGGVDVKN